MLEIHNALGVSWEIARPGLLPQGPAQDLLGRSAAPERDRPARRLLRPDELAVGQLRLGAAHGLGQRARAAHLRRQRLVQQLLPDALQRPGPSRRREPERHPLPPVLLHRLRALLRTARRRHRLLPRPLAPAKPMRRLGTRPADQQRRESTSPTSTAPTTTSSWRPKGRATTSAATSPSATSRAPGGARATT